TRCRKYECQGTPKRRTNELVRRLATAGLEVTERLLGEHAVEHRPDASEESRETARQLIHAHYAAEREQSHEEGILDEIDAFIVAEELRCERHPSSNPSLRLDCSAKAQPCDNTALHGRNAFTV